MKTANFSFTHSHLLHANMLWGNSVGADGIFEWQKKSITPYVWITLKG